MRMVARYVEVYPSRSYTLNRLGDHLPEFLTTLDDLPKRDFCHELARLEYALTGVFDAGETSPLSPDAVRAVPPDAWETARLKPIEAFKLLEFEYPVSRYLGFVDEENPAPRLARKKTWVVAYRRNYHVHRMDLTEPAYELLSALASGQTVGDCHRQRDDAEVASSHETEAIIRVVPRLDGGGSVPRGRISRG